MSNLQQDRIRRVYLCRSEQIDMVVFLFMEKGDHPRAIAKIQQQTGSILFIEFPSLPLQLLEQRVEDNVRSFSREFGGEVTGVEWPQGCSPRQLLIAIHQARDEAREPQSPIH